jgi:AcrR family transcriptional regulator
MKHRSKTREISGNRLTLPRAGRRQRRSDETRERIFRAALRLFAAQGFPATTVEAITEAADVGKGTFFNYFPTKEHVLSAFGELQRGKIEHALAVARTEQKPIRTVLREMVRAASEEPGRSPALFRSIIFAMLSGEAVREVMLRNLDLARERLDEIISLGQHRGEIKSDRPASELARSLQRLAFGTMLYWSLNPANSLTGELDATFEMFWSGIGDPTKTSGPGSSRKERRP